MADDTWEARLQAMADILGGSDPNEIEPLVAKQPEVPEEMTIDGSISFGSVAGQAYATAREASRSEQYKSKVQAYARATGQQVKPAKFDEGSKGELQQYAASQLAKFGWTQAEMSALITLWNKESGWNPNAQNPTSTAYGIAQFLNTTWKGTGIAKTADGRKQIDAGLIYIKARYGAPSAALDFHKRKNWY